MQQLEIYEVFNLAMPHKKFSACYNINNRYLGIMHDETKAVEISEGQFNMCQKANRQFCSLNTPLLPLLNPPTCIAAVSHSGVVVSNHGLYAGSLGSIPTAVNTMTAAGGDAEHVSLNH